MSIVYIGARHDAALVQPVARRRRLVTYWGDTCVATCVVGLGSSLSVALTALIVSSEVAATNRSTAEDRVIVLRLAIGITYYVDGCGVAAVVLLWAAALLWTTAHTIVPRYTLLPRQWAPPPRVVLGIIARPRNLLTYIFKQPRKPPRSYFIWDTQRRRRAL